MKKYVSIIAGLCSAVLLLSPGTVLANAAPDGLYNFQPADYYAVVDTEEGYTDLRYGPGIEYAVINPVYNGELVHVSETLKNFFDQKQWAHLDFGELSGWVLEDELTVVDNPYADGGEPGEFNESGEFSEPDEFSESDEFSEPDEFRESDEFSEPGDTAGELPQEPAPRILERVNTYDESGTLVCWESYLYNKSDIFPAECIEHRQDGTEWVRTFCFDDRERLTAIILTGLPEEIRYMYPEQYIWEDQTASQRTDHPGVSIYCGGFEYDGDRKIRELQVPADYGAIFVKEYFYDEQGRIAETYGDIMYSSERWEYLKDQNGREITRIWHMDDAYYDDCIYDDQGRLILREYHEANETGGPATGLVYEYFEDQYFNFCCLYAPLMSDYGTYSFELHDTAGNTIFYYIAGGDSELVYDEQGYLQEIRSGGWRLEFVYMKTDAE